MTATEGRDHTAERRAGGAPAEEPPRSHTQRASDHLANERTFLAWIRTAVSIIALGFVVSKFTLYLRALSAGHGSLPSPSGRSVLLGSGLVAFGALTVVLALARFLLTRRQLEAETYRPAIWLDVSIAVLITLGAVLMMVFVLTSTLNG